MIIQFTFHLLSLPLLLLKYNFKTEKQKKKNEIGEMLISSTIKLLLHFYNSKL